MGVRRLEALAAEADFSRGNEVGDDFHVGPLRADNALRDPEQILVCDSHLEGAEILVEEGATSDQSGDRLVTK